jgi:hypothetical protein
MAAIWGLAASRRCNTLSTRPTGWAPGGTSPRVPPPYADRAAYLRALENNKRWIRDRIREGYDFYTIGIDPRRTARGQFYKAELETLARRGITPIHVPWVRK